MERIIICKTTAILANYLEILELDGFKILRIEVIPHDFGGVNQYNVVYVG